MLLEIISQVDGFVSGRDFSRADNCNFMDQGFRAWVRTVFNSGSWSANAENQSAAGACMIAQDGAQRSPG